MKDVRFIAGQSSFDMNEQTNATVLVGVAFRISITKHGIDYGNNHDKSHLILNSNERTAE